MGMKARGGKAADKKFMFLTYGFKQPTPEDMGAWGAWFESIADRMLDQGGFWAGGRELKKKSQKDLPFGKSSLTGFVIFTAKDLEEAEALAKGCPVVASNQVYEIMTKG